MDVGGWAGARPRRRGVLPLEQCRAVSVATREDEFAAGAIGSRCSPRGWRIRRERAVVALGGILAVDALGLMGPPSSLRVHDPDPGDARGGGMRTITGAIVGTVFITVGKEMTLFLGDGPHFPASTGPSSTACPISSSPGSWRCDARGRTACLASSTSAGRWRAGGATRRHLAGGRRHRPAVAPSTAWLATEGSAWASVSSRGRRCVDPG